jgi:hypothetical protein
LIGNLNQFLGGRRLVIIKIQIGDKVSLGIGGDGSGIIWEFVVMPISGDDYDSAVNNGEELLRNRGEGKGGKVVGGLIWVDGKEKLIEIMWKFQGKLKKIQ